MYKKALFCLVLLCLAISVYSEAPELKSVAFHSYKELYEVPPKKALPLITLCKESLSERVALQNMPFTPEVLALYAQDVRGITFYRLFLAHKKPLSQLAKEKAYYIEEKNYSLANFDYLRSNDTELFECLFAYRGGTLIFVDFARFGHWEESNEEGLSVIYEDFLIKPSALSADAVGICRISARLNVERGLTRENQVRVRLNRLNAEVCARQSAVYSVISGAEGSSLLPDAICSVTASDFLFDKEIPLRFSLFSALDGNKNTCFTENAIDNAIDLDFAFFAPVTVSQAACINGTAENRDCYMKNNRVAVFSVSSALMRGTEEHFSAQLRDNVLDRQIMYLPFLEKSTDYKFITAQMYRGTKSELSISEFNLKLKEKGWLFADF